MPHICSASPPLGLNTDRCITKLEFVTSSEAEGVNCYWTFTSNSSKYYLMTSIVFKSEWLTLLVKNAQAEIRQLTNFSFLQIWTITKHLRRKANFHTRRTNRRTIWSTDVHSRRSRLALCYFLSFLSFHPYFLPPRWISRKISPN